MSDFAEAQLAKFGWQKGKGLGRNNEGIKRAISVVKKNDTKGLGAKEQFDFAWWDHVYNKTSNSIKIEKSSEGVSVSKQGGEAQRNRMGIISTERPSAVSSSVESSDVESGVSTPTPKAKSLLYGLFVKSGNTIQNNTEIITKVTNEETKDYSMRISDKELFEACDGRTARKGARGDQSGKLSRIDKDLVLKKSTKEEKKKRKADETAEESVKKSKKGKKEKKEKKEKKSKEDKKEKKSKKVKSDGSNKEKKKEKKSKA